MKPLFANREVDVLGHKFELSLSVQFALFAGLLMVLIYAVFLGGYPPLHDPFHEFRHSFGIIACH
jgi:hypothetical protein